MRCTHLDGNSQRSTKASLVRAFVRVIQGYRTVSWTAATLLTGDNPWQLQMEVLAEVYRHRATTRDKRGSPDVDEVERIRAAGRAALI